MSNVNTFNVWGQEARQNPHLLYAQMRLIAPVYRATGPVSGGTFWFLTRYEDCVTMLRDPRFGKVFTKGLTPEQVAVLPPPNEALEAIDYHMLNLDPPDHTRVRGLVHKAFTPAMMEGLRGRVQQVADDLLDGIEAGGEKRIDLIEAYAYPLPIIVIAELLGIPTKDRAQFRQWTKQILFGGSMQEVAVAIMALMGYLRPIFEARRAEPKDDLISALVMAEDAGDKLKPNELTSMLFLLLVAGHETTVNLISNGMIALMENPGEMAWLKNDFSLVKSAVEEMLRYNGPLENTLSRWAYEDVEIGGQVIRRGDTVMATLLAANRDPEVFPDPNRFDIARNPNKHIAFGNGIHYCLGAPLARIEGAIAVESLVRRFPNISLAVNSNKLEWSNQVLLRGVRELPVRLH